MLALVRLLASMCPNMNCESTPLNEALTAAWCHTGVRPLIGVDAIMPLKVRLAVKALKYHISGSVGSYRNSLLPCCMFASHTGRVSHSAHSLPVP